VTKAKAALCSLEPSRCSAPGAGGGSGTEAGPGEGRRGDSGATELYLSPHLAREVTARHQRLTPVILATEEAEITRFGIQGQPEANNMRDPISKKLSQKKAGGLA
jgi:hypothetical protein